MKITVTETKTTIEATSSELSASQTLGQKLTSLLASVLNPYTAYDESCEEDKDVREDQDVDA